MLDERSTGGLSKASDDVDHAGRKADLGKPFRSLESRERSLLGGLENAGATGGERGSELPCAHQEGIVPRDDLSGDADGLFQRERHGVVGNGIYVAENFGGEPAVVFEAGGGVVDIEFGLDDRLAGVAGFELGQHRQVLTNLVGETEKNAATFLGRSGGPCAVFKGGFRGGDGAVHVVGIGVWNLGDDFLARGIVDGEGFRGLAIDPFTIDVHLISADVGFDSTRHKDLLCVRAKARRKN